MVRKHVQCAIKTDYLSDEESKSSNELEHLTRKYADSVTMYQKKRSEISQMIQLEQKASTVLYVVYRSDILRYLSWKQWFVHYLPWPVTLFIVWIMQLLAFIVMELEHEKNGEHESKDTKLLMGRIIAILMLGIYTTMTGTSQRCTIRCAVFDGIQTKNMRYYLFLICPILQAFIEIIALRVSVDVILEAPTVIDIFQDAMSMIIILEIDNWVSMAVSKKDLGLTDEMFTIDLKNDDTRIDEWVSGILYGIIFICKMTILVWDVYHEIYVTY
eukprot:85991_1